MFKNKKSTIIALFLVILFLILMQGTAVFAASRFEEVITRFNNIFFHSGTISHEHKFSLANGWAALFAAGEGQIGGSHEGWNIESKGVLPGYRSAHSSGQYYITTAQNARSGQYLRAISGTQIGDDHSSRSGVMPNPGETGYIRETVSASSDSNGTYFQHSSNFGTSDGTTRMETSTDGSTMAIDVEGYSEVFEMITIDNGGPKTGWWGFP